MNARRTLLTVGTAYAVWETVDIFWIDVPAMAAVFALLFAGATTWFWRRNSTRAAVALLALCAFEAAVAPGLHAETVTKVCDLALGVTGVVAAALVVIRGRRTVSPLVSAVAAVALVAAGSAFASSNADAPQTLKFLSVQKQFTMLPQVGPKTPPQIGGRLVFQDVLYNRAPQFGKPAGARIGRAESVCTIVSLGDAQCTITAHVPNGQFAAMGGMVLREGLTTEHFGVVGGTGAYANAHGTATGRDVSETKSFVDIALGS